MILIIIMMRDGLVQLIEHLEESLNQDTVLQNFGLTQQVIKN